MKTLKALFACLFAGLVVMGFVGCSQPSGADDPIIDSYEYNGTMLWGESGSSIAVNLSVDKDGTWILLMDEKDFMKGTYEGGLTVLDSDGQITVKVTHSSDEDVLKPVDEPYDIPCTMSENGKKMSFEFGGEPVVLTRK